MSDDNGFRGPSVPRANASVNGTPTSSQPTRRDLSRHSESFEGRRNLYDALGYDETTELSFATYWGRYQRDGLATALVDRFVESTWQSSPIATPGEGDEAEASVDESSTFSTAVASLFDGGALRQPFGSSLRRSVPEAISLADTYATIGHYSLLFIGFRDTGPDTSLSEPIEEGSVSGDISDAVAYVEPVNQAQVSDIDLVKDRGDRRHGLPKRYDIHFDDDEKGTEEVHHSRVIHIPEGARTSVTHGTPVFLKGWNRFDDIEKLLGGSAEQAWRGAYNGMAVQPPRDADGNLMTFADDNDIEEQVSEYRHNMRRVIRSTGEIEMLEPNIADVSNHIEMQFQAISAAYDIPQSIYRGNETGERATTEDKSQWAETISSRRNYAESRIVRPLLDRLAYVGALDAPDTYSIEWTSLTELSEQEWADLIQTKSQAIDLISAGQPDTLFSEQERRKILGYPEERGSMTATPDDDESFDDVDPASEIDEGASVGFDEQTGVGDERQ